MVDEESKLLAPLISLIPANAASDLFLLIRRRKAVGLTVARSYEKCLSLL
jgi:hypothetical protein